MGNPLSEAGLFLINTIFYIIMLVFAIRLILEYVRADFHHPLSQAIAKLTAPLVTPLRKIFPSVRNINLACLVSLLLIGLIKVFLIAFVVYSLLPNILGATVWAMGDTLSLLVNVFFFAILIQVIMSWVNPNTYNSTMVLIYKIAEPVMAPMRRLIPPVSGLDLSPIPAMIVLQLCQILLAKPLTAYGLAMAMR